MSSSSSRSTIIGSRRPNAARERSRVQSLRDAFQSLQSALPAVPPSTKLSKLDVLLMASAYIAHLGRLVEEDRDNDEQHANLHTNNSVNSHVTFHPVKKWPMRARLYAGLNYSGSHRPLDQTKVYRHHHSVELDRQMLAEESHGNRSSSTGSQLLRRIRREIHQQRHQCPIQPDPRSPHLQRRSLCPFEIQRDTNPQRIPDVILRSHCLCESSPCSFGQSQGQQPARCVSLVSPMKVAYLDQQLKQVVSTEIIHVPVACICAAQPAGRHMPLHRNIVV